MTEFRKYVPMLASVQARAKAPNENVVGSPIREFAQSFSVRNDVAAMNRSGSTAEAQRSASPPTKGHGWRIRSRRHAGAATATSATLSSAVLPGQHADLEEADHEHDQDERHADRGGVAHVLVRERLLVDVELGDVGVGAGAAVRDRVDVGEHERERGDR